MKSTPSNLEHSLRAEIAELRACLDQTRQTEAALLKKQTGLEAALQKANDDLEQGVRERTAQLHFANNELLKREASLRVLGDNIPNGTIYQLLRTAGGKERFEYISAGLIDRFSVKLAQEDADNLFSRIHPEDASRIMAAREESIRNLTIFNVEGRIITSTGEIRWMHWRSTPRRLENGDTISDGIVTDITTLAQAITALKRANRALRVLKECNEVLSRANDETGMLHQICEIIVEESGANMAWFGMPEEEKKTVRPVASAKGTRRFLKETHITWDNTVRGRGPTGTAVRTGKVNICHDTMRDPRMAPWRSNLKKYNFTASIAVPLLSASRCIGVLSIYSPEADAFNAEEVELLQQLAKDLAFGLVALRTRAESERLQKELLVISEREKQLISQELHDGLCQNLAGTAMMANVLEKRLAAAGHPETASVKQICEMLNENVKETRNLSHGLHPVGPNGEGLMNALSHLARTVSNFFHIRCTFRCPEPVIITNEVISTHLLRIAQEAVNNARRHGEASAIVITLLNSPEGKKLSIRDNGVGMPKKAPKKTGLGIRIMHHRASQIGVTVEVRRGAKKGTEVVCTLPEKPRRKTPARKGTKKPKSRRVRCRPAPRAA